MPTPEVIANRKVQLTHYFNQKMGHQPDATRARLVDYFASNDSALDALKQTVVQTGNNVPMAIIMLRNPEIKQWANQHGMASTMEFAQEAMKAGIDPGVAMKQAIAQNTNPMQATQALQNEIASGKPGELAMKGLTIPMTGMMYKGIGKGTGMLSKRLGLNWLGNKLGAKALGGLAGQLASKAGYVPAAASKGLMGSIGAGLTQAAPLMSAAGAGIHGVKYLSAANAGNLSNLLKAEDSRINERFKGRTGKNYDDWGVKEHALNIGNAIPGIWDMSSGGAGAQTVQTLTRGYGSDAANQLRELRKARGANSKLGLLDHIYMPASLAAENSRYKPAEAYADVWDKDIYKKYKADARAKYKGLDQQSLHNIVRDRMIPEGSYAKGGYTHSLSDSFKKIYKKRHGKDL